MIDNNLNIPRNFSGQIIKSGKYEGKKKNAKKNDFLVFEFNVKNIKNNKSFLQFYIF